MAASSWLELDPAWPAAVMYDSCHPTRSPPRAQRSSTSVRSATCCSNNTCAPLSLVRTQRKPLDRLAPEGRSDSLQWHRTVRTGQGGRATRSNRAEFRSVYPRVACLARNATSPRSLCLACCLAAWGHWEPHPSPLAAPRPGCKGRHRQGHAAKSFESVHTSGPSSYTVMRAYGGLQ